MNILIQRPFLIYFIVCTCLFFSNYSLLIWSTFSVDDTHIIQLALRFSWLEPYTTPTVYQQLSMVHYTPVVLNIYRVIVDLFGLNTSAFVTVQLLLITIFSSLLGFFCWRETERISAGFLAIVLMFSNTSLLPMLSHFYTIHYILGGIFSLLAMLLIQRRNWFSILDLFALFSVLTFALLCKEVYLMLVPILWFFLWCRQQYIAIAVVTFSLGCYLGLRFYILGFSGEGRSGESFLADLLRIDFATWANFFKWYLSTKWLIVIMAVVAMIVAPRKQIIYLFAAFALVLPSLAAPHAFRVPELHGDRLFFAFDSGLVIASVIAIYTQFISIKLISAIIFTFFIIAIPLQRLTIQNFSELETAKPAYQITQTILYKLAKSPTTVLTPLFYLQGELMNIYRLMGNPWLVITQNCSQALFQYTDRRKLIVFSDAGKEIPLKTLRQSCKLTGRPAIANVSPEFANGLLQWDISVPDGFRGGVLFLDRGFAMPATKFQERLVRPRPGEQYQLFTNKGDQWWFSDIQVINIH